MRYLIKTPWWLKRIYPSYIWQIKTEEKKLYLTFDDGPHPIATPFVLDQLKKYNAKATFFCIGKNVSAYPEIYHRILNEGHQVGNHTQNHINGWKTNPETYLNDVEEAAQKIKSSLFRPPYGRITKYQARRIPKALGSTEAKIIMWTILSGDFDESISKERCLENSMQHVNPGTITVFHDSEKAFPRLEYALPAVLAHFSEKGFRFEGVEAKP